VVLVFPAQLHEGDRFTDAAGDEWEVASRPVTYKQGHEVRACVQRPGNPATVKEEFWLAYERVTIRRPSALAVVTDPTDSRRASREFPRAGYRPGACPPTKMWRL